MERISIFLRLYLNENTSPSQPPCRTIFLHNVPVTTATKGRRVVSR